tara:strand:+ start:3467 stop:3925 length:459 start_codon:yes stop_codon:yes gene_type:complete
MLTTLLFIVLIAAAVVGINFMFEKLKQKAAEAKQRYGDINQAMHVRPVVTPKPKAEEIDVKINALFKYTMNEAWVEKGTVFYVNNPIITKMLEDIDKIEPLEYNLPQKGVGVYAVIPEDDRISDEVYQKLESAGFERYVIISGRAIGYRQKS